MKITLRQLQLGPPSRVPGQYYLRSTKHGVILSKWPKKRGTASTPAQFYKETEFGLAASWASSPDGGQLESAIALADGTVMVPRDFLTMAAYGTVLELSTEQGVPWTQYRSVTVNAQLVLDQVTDEIGQLMYRAPVGWIGFGPGSNGQYLQIVNGVPTFVTVGAPGATTPLTNAPLGLTPGAASNTGVNALTGKFHQLNVGSVVTGIAVYANAAAATTRVTPGLWQVVIGGATALVASGPQKIGLVKGWNLIPFSAQYLVTQSDVFAAGLQIATAVFSQVNLSPALAGWVATSALPLPNPLAITAIAANNTNVNTYLY